MFKTRHFILYFCSFLSLCLIGASFPSEAQNRQRLIRDTEIETSLYRMSQPVFQAAGIGRNDIRLIIVQDPNLNAFVAGGLNIFLYTGTIFASETPDELLGVIAHETGHIAGAHLIRTREALEKASFQSLLASIVGAAAILGGGGDAGAAVLSGGASLAQQGILRHTRAQEAAADQAAVSYLTDANYSTAGLVNFLEKLKSQELLPSAQQPEYLRTHPLTRNRISYLEQKTRRKSTRDAAFLTRQTQDFERIKAKLRGYLYPDQALRFPGETISERYAQAIAYYRKGKIKTAITRTDALIKEEPKNAYFYELKGQILFENGRSAESVKAYKKALKYAPNAGLIQMSYGQALLSEAKTEKQFSTAVEILERALTSENRSPQLHRLIATGYGHLGHEGAVRVHLAEEALLQRNVSALKRQIGLAEKHITPSSRKWLRLQDLKTILETNDL